MKSRTGWAEELGPLQLFHAHSLSFSPLSRSEMKRWMISLAPNRRTKFVSFTSRLVGKRHSMGAGSSSPLSQGTLFCLISVQPHIWDLHQS